MQAGAARLIRLPLRLLFLLNLLVKPIRLAQTRQLPALIVLDLQLPDGDGLDLARRLKATPQTASCVILACTAEAMQGDAERALAAGCDAYVSKPIDTREFSALVDELLRRAAPAPAPEEAV